MYFWKAYLPLLLSCKYEIDHPLGVTFTGEHQKQAKFQLNLKPVTDMLCCTGHDKDYATLDMKHHYGN